MKYACFTVGQPETWPRETLEQLKAAGYTGVEWRVTDDQGDMDKPSYWSGNRSTLQSGWADDQFREIADLMSDVGIAAAALGTYLNAGDPSSIERMMEVANILGAPCIRVDSCRYDGTRHYDECFGEAVQNFGVIADLAKKHGVKAIIETHPNLICTSASGAMRLVSHFDPEQIGVVHDAGNMVGEGYEHYQMAFEMLGPYLAHVHIKSGAWHAEDADPPLRKKWTFSGAPLRSGSVDFAFLLRSLRKVGYDGWLSFEDFSSDASQAEKVADNIAFMKEIEALVAKA